MDHLKPLSYEWYFEFIIHNKDLILILLLNGALQIYEEDTK